MGYVPDKIIKAVSVVLDFIYIVRRLVFTSATIAELEAVLLKYEGSREIFHITLVRPEGFELPRQHSIIHFPFSITRIGAPNTVCTSITESMHIRAVKDAYRRSNRNEEMGQVLLINQRTDKLAVARVDFECRGMLGTSRDPQDITMGLHTRAQTDAVASPNGCGLGIDDSESGLQEEGNSFEDTEDIGDVHWYGIDSIVTLAKVPGRLSLTHYEHFHPNEPV